MPKKASRKGMHMLAWEVLTIPKIMSLDDYNSILRQCCSGEISLETAKLIFSRLAFEKSKDLADREAQHVLDLLTAFEGQKVDELLDLLNHRDDTLEQ